jgi:hypothetical protein
MPRKEFESFTRLDASDVNTYLMDQSVMTFGGTAARGSAIPTPVEGMVTYLEDSNSLQLYDGDGWGLASGIGSGNFIINGAMQVAQRGTATSSITTGGYYTADRFAFVPVSQGTWTQSIENDSPTGSGFRKSFKALCTTADAAPSGTDVVVVQHKLEGQNLQSIRKGTSEAKEITLSFWVKSNVTGTYVVRLADIDNNRQVAATYSVLSSGTWEKKVITFPADTNGALDNDNNESLTLNFGLGAGPDRTSGTLPTVWESVVTANQYVGQVNLAAATSNYWQITGVQLELGNVASDFDFQDIQSELAACQRYYWRGANNGAFTFYGFGGANSTTNSDVVIALPTSLRINPSSVDFSAIALQPISGGGITAITSVGVLSGNSSNIAIACGVASGLTSGTSYRLITNNSTSGFLGVSAEL